MSEVSQTAKTLTVLCKDCGAEVPKLEDFQPWCECGWNLHAEKEEFKGYLDKKYYALGKERGRQIFEMLKEKPDKVSSFSFNRLFLFTLCLLVVLAGAITLFTGIALLYFFKPNVFTVMGALVLFVLTYFISPKLLHAPTDTLSRKKYPNLWKLVDDVSAALGVDPPGLLSVNNDYKTNVNRYGLKQERGLTLGLPYLMVLNKQERVALVAHEMSHFAHGDPARGLFFRHCIDSLEDWYLVLHPNEIWEAYAPFSEAVGNVLMLMVSQIPAALIWVMVRLHWDDSQICEYLADRSAAKVSGTEASFTLLAKSHLAPYFDIFVQRKALKKEKESLLDRLREFVSTFPERQYEKVKRQCAMEDTRLDATHPPTAWRQALLQQSTIYEPRVQLSDEENEKLNGELEKLAPAIEKTLLDDYRTSLLDDTW